MFTCGQKGEINGMSLRVDERRLRVEQVIGEGTASVTTEGILELPAGKPDIERVLQFRIEPRVTETVVENGNVIVRGVVEGFLLYVAVAPPGAPQQPVHFAEFPTGLNFQTAVEIPGAAADQGMLAFAQAAGVSAQADVLPNPRQVQATVTLSLFVKVTKEAQLNVITNVTAIPPEQVRVVRELLRVEQVIGESKSRRTIEESVTLPAQKPDVERILDIRARSHITSTRIEKDRVIVEGDIVADIIYVAAVAPGLPQQPVHFAEMPPIHFTQVVDVAGARSGMVAYTQVNVELVNGDIESPRSIRVRVTQSVSAKVVEPLQMDVVTDCISETGEKVEIRRELLRVEDVVGENTEKTVVSGRMNIPATKPDVEQVLSWTSQFTERNVELRPGQVIIDGTVSINVMYVGDVPDGSQPVHYVEFPDAISAAIVVDVPGAGPGMKAHTYVNVLATDVTMVDADTLQANVVLEAFAKVTTYRQMEVAVECVAVSPPTGEPPSMLVVVVQPGDTLWKLSRKYGTTVDAIVRANNIADPNNLQVGMKLRIPVGTGTDPA